MSTSTERHVEGAGLKDLGAVSPASERSFCEVDEDSLRSRLLQAAAHLIADRSFAMVELDAVAADAQVDVDRARREFETMLEIGDAILDLERDSMRDVQRCTTEATANPLEQLVLAFRLVGENLSRDIVVRAGVRIATESRGLFPNRRLDPFQTWQSFVDDCIDRAHAQGLLREDTNLAATVWILVTAGMGTLDFVSWKNEWELAPERLEFSARTVLALVTPATRSADGEAPA